MESPPFKECLCELCDCGRHKRHKNCRKQQVLLMQPKTGMGWISHYKATYTSPPAVHPRSSKRPPCTPPHPNPPPMDLQTTQRTEFVIWDPGKRTKHLLKERRGQHPQRPSQSQALCCLPFPPRASALSQHPSKLQPYSPIIKNSSRSKGSSQRFKREHPDQPGANVIATPNHPLSLEKGAFLGEKRALTKSSEPAAAEYVTRYQSDFPERGSFLGQAAAALPPLDNLAINPAFRTNFQTVQRESYRRWNTSAYSRAKLITLKKNQGAEEAGKFEDDDLTKLPYHLPVLLNHAEPIKDPSTALKSLDNSTAHRFFFRDWGAQPRIRYGDPREGSCTHSLGHFGSQTTTCGTYLLKRAEKAKSYKPELKPIQTEGGQDFATIHREAYRPFPLPVCRLQIYLAQQKKSRKEDCEA